MLSWLPIALSVWWLAGGGPQELPRVLWAEGPVAVVGFAGVEESVTTASPMPGAQVAVGERGLLWVLDGRGDVHGLRGPGVYRLQRAGNTDGEAKGSTPAVLPLGDNTPDVITLQERFDTGADQLAGQVVKQSKTRRAIQVKATPRDTAITEAQPVLRWPTPPGQAFDLVIETQPDNGPVFVVERWRGLRLGYHHPQTLLKTGQWYRWTLSPSPPDLWAAAAASLVPFGPPWVNFGEPKDSLDAGAGEALATEKEGYWFRILPEQRRQSLARELARCDALQDAPDGIGPAAAVLRALLLERAGLLQAAEDAWRALASAHPMDEGIAERLSSVTYRTLKPPGATAPWRPRIIDFAADLGLDWSDLL